MWFLNLLSILLFSTVKILSLCFFRVKSNWISNTDNKGWDHDVRLFVFLNHTSLFEPLFVGAIPFHFIFWGAPRLVVPGADKTLNRPIVGTFFKLLVPKMISITRRRDKTWDAFLGVVEPTSFVVILPEGRMKRTTGLDLSGHEMSIRGGVSDILEKIESGRMIIAYSGGLHHVQAPGEWRLKIFKTIQISFESLSITAYKEHITKEAGGGSFKAAVIRDLTHRLKTRLPC